MRATEWGEIRAGDPSDAPPTKKQRVRPVEGRALSFGPVTTPVFLVFAPAAVAAFLVFAPGAVEDSDPHMPNASADWCQGGKYREPLSGGAKYCLGVPFSSGAFYAQRWVDSVSPFVPGSWQDVAMCSVMLDGIVQDGMPSGGIPDCDGGPRTVLF